MNERQVHAQEVKEPKSGGSGGLRGGTERPRPARVQKSPFARRVVKTGPLPVYYRIWETLASLANQFGIVVVHVQNLVFAVRDQFPEYSRPTIGEVDAAVIYGAYTQRLERLPHRDPEGVIAVRILKGSKNGR